jgi:predicted amidohydrolase YtcJ
MIFDPMKRTIVLTIIACVALIAGMLYWFLTPQSADLLLVNGIVYTVDRRGSVQEAVAIKHGRILAVGKTSEITSRYAAPRVIDLDHRAVYPGFIDAHAHFESLGAMLKNINLAGSTSVEEIQQKIAAAVKERKEGEWIRGRGWDQNLWNVKKFPEHADLDRIAPANPVYLSRVDGHAVWVNARVLAMVGVNAATPDPEGGRILRDAAGNPTGVFVDNAIGLLSSILPAPTPDERTASLRAALDACLKVGLTEVHDMGVDSLGIALYKKLMTQGEFPFRIYAAIEGLGSFWEHTAHPEIDLFDGKLTIRALKMYADGALGSRGAALIAPYSDDPENRGLTVTTAETLRAAADQCLHKGFQMCTHAIGDRANTIVLSVYESVFLDNGINGADRRFRVEHAQVLDPGDVGRFHRLGVIPSMQPTHCTSDMGWAEERLGPARVKYAYAWHSLIADGNTIPAGSDFPVESPNPLLGFYAAITRQNVAGKPEGGWYPEERMTRDEALRAFTIWAADAAFQEHSKGTLEAGKWADLVVLSDDIMTIPPERIPATAVRLTIVGGQIAYESRGAQ